MGIMLEGITLAGNLDLMTDPTIASLEFNPDTHTYHVIKKNLDVLNPPSVTHITASVFGNGLINVRPDILEKAAQRGKLVHEEIYIYGKEGIPGFSLEFSAARKEIDKILVDDVVWEGEQIVYAEMPGTLYGFCGTIDCCFCYRENRCVIVDYKTTSALNKRSVKRQLNMYAYALRKQGYNVEKLEAWHIVGEKLRRVEIELEDDSYTEMILESFYNGLSFKNDKEMIEHYKENVYAN